jgi:hypothetical protein
MNKFTIILIVLGTLFCTTNISAQVWIDTRFGLSRDSFFKFDKSNQNGEVRSDLGGYASISLRHPLTTNISAYYGLEFQHIRAGSTFEQGQGSSVSGHHLQFAVDYLSARIGFTQYIFESKKFQVSGSFGLILGHQIRNNTNGTTWKFVSEQFLGPNDEIYYVFVKRTDKITDQSFKEVNSYFAGASAGILICYNLADRWQLIMETFYSFTFTPFLKPGSHNLLRNGLNGGVGLSYLLSKK